MSARRYDIYYKIAKAEKHKNLKKKRKKKTHIEQQFPPLGGIDFRQLTLFCALLFGLLNANCFTLVPENVSDMK